MKALISLIFFFSLSTYASSTKYDVPKSQHEWKEHISGSESRDIKFRCLNYEHFVIFEKDDPYNMGAIELLVRVPSSKNQQASVCKKSYKGKETDFSNTEGYFAGAFGKYIFIDGADAFGNQLKFDVIDTETGKNVFSALQDMNENFVIQKLGTKTGLQFYKSLEVKCPLLIEGATCWEKILSDNKIPKDLRLQMPDCNPAFQKAKSPKNNTAQIGVKVSISDLDSPQVTYLAGAVTCFPAP